MCCGEFIMKYMLILANLLFTLIGIAAIGLGIVVVLNINGVVGSLPVIVNTTPIALIVIGAVVFVISFFGCCGAFKKNRCYLITYAICMAVLAAVKIYCVTMIFLHMSNMDDLVEKWVTDVFNKNDTITFSSLESLFKCCGTTGADSYICDLPETCCSCPINNICLREVAYEGCVPRLTNYFNTFGGSTGGGLVIVILVEIIAVVLASCLAHTIKKKNEEKARKNQK